MDTGTERTRTAERARARTHQRGRRLRRGIVILPNAFTLGNLFFGFWSIVATTRGEYELAAWLIFAAAVADGLDGRVARFSRTGSPFGVELDSLVDLVSFGVAPAVLMYQLFLQAGDWSWTLAFLYASAVALRLARFNIEQGGHAKVHFHGLPSPVAGVTLASWYPFSQTEFFTQHVAGWPWPQLIGVGMIVLSGLMLSHMLYPQIPPLALRTMRGRIGVLSIAVGIGLLIWNPDLVVFPVGLVYVSYGAGKAVLLGLLDRGADRDPLSEELDAEGEEEERDLEYEEMRPRWESRRGGGQMDRGSPSD